MNSLRFIVTLLLLIFSFLLTTFFLIIHNEFSIIKPLTDAPILQFADQYYPMLSVVNIVCLLFLVITFYTKKSIYYFRTFIQFSSFSLFLFGLTILFSEPWVLFNGRMPHQVLTPSTDLQLSINHWILLIILWLFNHFLVLTFPSFQPNNRHKSFFIHFLLNFSPFLIYLLLCLVLLPFLQKPETWIYTTG